MDIEYLLFDSLTPQYHKSYVETRKNAGMSYVEDFDQWLSKTNELEKLNAQYRNGAWENSEHNPVNYPDWDSLDDDTKNKRITQGKKDYWTESEHLESKIFTLEALLVHLDEIERISDDGDEGAVEYYTVDD